MIPNLVQNIGETCDNRALVYGGAVTFDGVSSLSFINIPYSLYTQEQGWSLEINIYITSFIQFNVVVRGQGNQFGFTSNATTNQINSYFNYTDAGIISLNTWYKIRFERRNNSFFVYNNDVLKHTISSSIQSGIFGGVDCNIGHPLTLNRCSYNLYGFILKELSTNNTQGFYKLDEMNGTTAFDSSGNGRNGTLQGGASYINTTEFSFRDNYGYSDGTEIYAGVYIPRDESNIKFDVLGDNLEYKGAACDLLI